MGDDFGIGGGLELIALGLEPFFEHAEVFDHAVVNDGHDTVAAKCGWALPSVAGPCVAQRVWPMPTWSR